LCSVYLGQGRDPALPKTGASVLEELEEPITEEMTMPGLLEHMVTNSSNKTLHPTYSSWAITRLGDYNSYQPSSGENLPCFHYDDSSINVAAIMSGRWCPFTSVGLNQPGFLPQTNQLLSWDIIVKGFIKDQKWPSIGEQSQKQRKKQLPKKGGHNLITAE